MQDSRSTVTHPASELWWAAGGMADAADAAEWAIGCHVRLTTVLDEEVAGTIFAYDAATQSLMLKQPGSHGGVSNLRLLKASAIKAVHEARPAREAPDLRLPHVDKDRARQREDKALKQAEADLSKVGVGVTVEAQSVFDALCKTMPCAWHGKSIMVMDAVLVHPPYSTDSCEATPDHTGALERVKKVLQFERQRLGLV